MKYVSCDLETSSLEPHEDHILMFSFVVEDTRRPEVPVEGLPHFTGFVRQPVIKGQAYALAMNKWILEILAGRDSSPYPIYTPDGWACHVREFVNTHIGYKDGKPLRATVAGKNFAKFDDRFLPKEVSSLFRHRVLELGPQLVDWWEDDAVPDFAESKRRCGNSSPVAHDAREDAMDVIRCFRAIQAKARMFKHD